jgi:hypothetical protein
MDRSTAGPFSRAPGAWRSKALTCAVLVLASAQMARAGGVVGTGTADTCTEPALDAALAGGGLVTFDCGPEPVTITLTQQKTISSDTTVDGGGLLTLDGNDAVRAFWVAQGQALTVENLAIVKGNATDAGGGAIFNDGGTLTVTNSTFTGNSATLALLGFAAGGAIYTNGGTLTVADSTFTGNNAGLGGALYINGGTVTVTGSTFADNDQTASATLARIVGSLRPRPGPGLAGSAIYANRGTVTVTNSTFAGNSGAISNGGGIVNVINSTFAGNRDAISSGGGTVNVYNSTFAGNGISNGSGTVIVNSSTFAAGTIYNSAATTCGEAGNSPCVVVLRNTIVANSSSGGNCVGPIKDGGYNIDDGTTCGFRGAGCTFRGGTSLCNTNPQLDPAGLQNSGGPTQTIALEPGSPAIDAGSATFGESVDQRGFVRPGAGATTRSIGAYEFNSGPSCGTGLCVFPEVCIDGRCVPSTPTATITPGGPTLTPTPTPTATPANTATETPTRNDTATVTPHSTPTNARPPTPTSSPAPTPTRTEPRPTTTQPTRTPMPPTTAPTAARTAGVVGMGTADSCTEAALDAALAEGGVVTFDCSGPATIDISTGTGTKTIAADTTIDGGNLITLSGVKFVVNAGVEFTVQHLTLGNASARRWGGGVPPPVRPAIANNGGTLTVSDSILAGNSGGAIVNGASSVTTITNSTFAGNTVTNNGGTLTVSHSAFAGNGVAISNGGTLSVANSTFTDNSGGAIVNNAGSVTTVTNSTFSDNRSNANALGGAIANRGTLTVANSTVTGNGVGAIYNGGTLTVTNSTLSANIGGGTASYGGAIDNARTCGDDGTAPCSAMLWNTIVASSVSGHNCAGPITDGGDNLDDGTSCGFSAANASLSNTDPQLDPAGLKDNGGPTQTVALCTAVDMPAGCTAASPAIDAGDDSICAAAPVNDSDQRGFVRPGTSHTHCSTGAYETDAVAPLACIGDCNGNGSVTIDEVLTLVTIALGNPGSCPRGVPAAATVDVSLSLQAVRNALHGCH